MMRFRIKCAGMVLTLMLTAASYAQVAGQAQSRLLANYGKLPLRFEANRGQTDAQVQFVSQGSGYSLFLTSGEAVLVLATPVPKLSSPHPVPGPAADGASPQAVVRLQLAGANAQPVVTQEDELPTRSNYFIGSDPSKWHTNVPNYGRVRYHNVYPGVDLVYYGNQGQLEHDFVVAPGVDPSVVTLAVRGAERLQLEPNGDLAVRTAGGDLRLLKPEIYQVVDGRRRKVPGKYLLEGGNKVGFEIARYDRRQQLVIDPVLLYSTYLGGNGRDAAAGIAVDSNGNAYVTGDTGSTNFPTTTGAFQTDLTANFNVFVTKLNAAGTALVYSTYLGGTGIEDIGKAIAVDSSGDAYVTGLTYSTNFPVTSGAFQTHFGANANSWTGFVTKLNATGSALVYSSFLGGSGPDAGAGISVDSSGTAYITGNTQSSNFPTTAGAFQTAFAGTEMAFVTKVNSAGSALVYSTYLGGSSSTIAGNLGESIAVDSSGNAFVTGATGSPNFPTTPGAYQTALVGFGNAFVTKLNSTGTALLYSTYLGAGTDSGQGIAADSTGNAYVAGTTAQANFPTTSGAYQTTCTTGGFATTFVTKLNATGTSLLYSTCLGGVSTATTGTRPTGIALDPSGNAYVTGNTSTADFPTTAGAYQTVLGGPLGNAFVTELNATGSALVYSTFLGGSGGNVALGSGGDSGLGIALDPSGNIYIAGYTPSSNFPTTCGAFQTELNGSYNVFLAKFGNASGGTSTPTVMVTPSSTSITTAQSLTVTIGVSGGGCDPTATGSVTLTSGSYTSAATTLAGGNATITVPAGSLAASTDTLTATYTPDSNSSSTYNSASGTSTVTVTSTGRTTPTVTVSLSSMSITTAESLTVTIGVSGGGSNPTATGSVTLTSGIYSSAATTLASGSAMITVPAGALATSADTLTATYTPDSNSSSTYNSATGTSTVTVTAPAKTTPTVTVSPSSTSITTAQSLTVTIGVSGGGNPTATGSVTLTSGSYTSAATILVSGSATITVPAGSLATSMDTLTANYAPDSNSSSIYNSATGSNTVTVTSPAKTTPAVTVSPSSTSITTAQSLTVTIGVNGGGSNPTATGSVTLTSGSYTSAATTLSSGSAMITVPAGSLATSTDTLTATYTPDSASSTSYNGATGTSTVMVTAVVAPSFTISSATAPQTVSPGGTATYSITLTPQNGAFTTAVSLTVSGLPTGAKATFTPSSVTPGSAAASSTLTIQTATTTATATNPGWPLAAPALAALGLFFLPGKKRRRWIALSVLAFASLGALSTLTACGGGFGLRASATQYNITVTGSSGSVQQSTTVQLTVE